MLDLYHAILFEQPSFWSGYFRNQESDLPLMSEATRAQRIAAHGRPSIAENNLAGLRQACIKLRELLPRDWADKSSAAGMLALSDWPKKPQQQRDTKDRQSTLRSGCRCNDAVG